MLELSARRFVPPPIRRHGLTPRLSVIEEYTDNVFFTTNRRKDDWISVLAPGLHLLVEDPRGRLEADYSFEATAYAKNPKLNTAVGEQTGLLGGQYALTQRTRLALSEQFQSFEEPTELEVPGVPPSDVTIGRVSTRRNSLQLTGEHELTPTALLRLQASHLLQDSGRSSFDIFEGRAALEAQGTRRDRFRLEYRPRLFRFRRGADIETNAVLFDHGHEISETLIWKAMVGVERSEVRSGPINVVAEGRLQASIEMAIFEAGYKREFFPEANGGSTVPTDLVFGSTLIRLGKGLQAHASVLFRVVDGGESKRLAVRAGLVYVFAPGLAARLEYIHSRAEQEEPDREVRVNRFIFNLTVSF